MEVNMILLAAAALFLAFANGANDNFKGVASLYGSGSMSFAASSKLANFSTLAGSFVSLFLAQALAAKFSGKGLVPEVVVGMPLFALAVASAAAGTVWLATRLGLPISTTHALIGSLLGAGLMASSTGIAWAALAGGYVKPLLVSPVLAVGAALLLYPSLRSVRQRLGIRKDDCACVGVEHCGSVNAGKRGLGAAYSTGAVSVRLGHRESCEARYQGNFLGIRAQPLADFVHVVSGGLVGFARGLNDTPKIAALFMMTGLVGSRPALLAVGGAMLLGGWLALDRVAKTMSTRITDMNVGQGLSANLVTSALVIGASALGSPVSTTHVSCGALFGIGAVSGKARWKMIGAILAAWVVTLPLGALLGAAAFALFKGLGMG